MKLTVQASAPGSLMLMGEHAVLYGRQALVFAVSKRVRVSLQPRPDGNIRIQSHLGDLEVPVGRIKIQAPFRFVLAVLRQYERRITSGFDLRIESDFPHNVGLGSSSAVTVATCAVLERWTRPRVRLWALFQKARGIIREVQGLGSGADAAASVFGGLLAYRTFPARMLKLKRTFPLVVLYSGGKTPTVEVVRRVQRAMRNQPTLYQGVFDLMDKACGLAVRAIRQGNWRKLGELVNINQGLMDALGVNDARLSELVYALRADPDILGSKISGAGLGDCVIGIGRSNRTDWPGLLLPLEISQAGVTID